VLVVRETTSELETRDLDHPVICRCKKHPPLKVLVLGQIDPFHLCGLHLLLQYLCVVCGNRYAASVLEGILDHLPWSIVKHGVGLGLANSVGQTKMFLHAKEN
jgi:hypothetical protein